LEDAIKLAIIAFGSLCGKPKAHKFTEEKARIKDINSYRVPVKNTIATYYPKNSVNLTGSFFIGAEEKEAAKNLLIGEANMEDYHVLRVLNFMRTQPGRFKLGKQLITRIHCDPHEITKKFAKMFEEWARDATYTENRFMGAIKWGLDGCKLNALTEDAHWNFVGKPPVTKHKKKFIYVCQKGAFKGRVLDPFFSEIASDFLKTVAAAPKPGKLDAFTSKLFKMKADVRRVVRAHASIVLKNPKEKHPRITREIIRQMLDPRSYEGGMAKSPFDGGKGKIRIWVRPGKWKNKDSVLINEVEWTGENVDRALYKSTNQIVLQEKAETRV
jgi:hypothetical protein